MRRSLLVGLALLLVAAWVWLGVGLEGYVNRVVPTPLPAVDGATRSLHFGTPVVDLHADSLLFGRDLLERGNLGHVDLPRLREGGVALQVFTAVTVAPYGMNIDRTDPDTFDMLSLLAITQLSPMGWRTPWGRTRLHAERLEDLRARAEGRLRWIRSASDLDALRLARGRDRDVVGALLGMEGAHGLGDDPANLERAFDAGYRMIGLTHFFDNDFAGSAHGLAKGGLTELGSHTLARMEALGILLDLAHLSPRAIDEVLVQATKPMVVSHGGVKGTCDNARNLSDAHVRGIAARGGVIGIGYWRAAVCGTTPAHVAAAVRYVVDLVGDRHVALGSDYDGGTTVGFDTSQLPALTQALRDAGLPEDSVRRVLGENALRVLAVTLPSGT